METVSSPNSDSGVWKRGKEEGLAAGEVEMKKGARGGEAGGERARQMEGSWRLRAVFRPF